MNKNPQQTTRTRESLKRAFWDLYAEKPLEQVTVAEVAARAGYNRSTFYAYFKDTRDVFEQTQEEIYQFFEQNFPALYDPRDGEALLRDLRYYIGFIDANETYFRLLGQKGHIQFVQRLWNLLHERALQSRLFLRNLDDEISGYYIDFIFHAQVVMVSRWLQSGRDMPLEDLAKLMQTMLLHGISQVLLPTED